MLPTLWQNSQTDVQKFTNRIKIMTGEKNEEITYIRIKFAGNFQRVLSERIQDAL
jgi:hypothetical protein